MIYAKVKDSAKVLILVLVLVLVLALVLVLVLLQFCQSQGSCPSPGSLPKSRFLSNSSICQPKSRIVSQSPRSSPSPPTLPASHPTSHFISDFTSRSYVHLLQNTYIMLEVVQHEINNNKRILIPVDIQAIRQIAPNSVSNIYVYCSTTI